MLKAVATSVALGILVVSVMQYMGVPVPTAHDLLGGLTRLTHFQ
jgi:phosphate/sulfate permease